MSRSLALLVAAVLTAVSGCATIHHEAYRPAACPCSQAVVVVADGAGGFECTSAALREVITEDHLPIAVETLDWTHGCGRFLADQIDYDHARTEGARLAEFVRARRQSCPDSPIYLVSHSAGSAVVLAAAECLPPDSVNGIIFLAPSVSADHDLRPALRCSRGGVDVFYSARDWGYLGAGVGLVGTADRHWSAAAGRVGFRPAATTPEDAALYATRLRQHAWDRSVRWTGNRGGHYDCHEPCFLRAYVLPLLRS